ncbi:hypothetical protein SLA2020_469950 [Shorea laevis]
MLPPKKRRLSSRIGEKSDLIDGLPDDLVVSILCKLSSSAYRPSDFINTLLTCKRLNRLALHPLVLEKAGAKALAVRAKNWSESAHRFLRLCVSAGNIEACYTLGMIRFYCLQNWVSGASLMAKAAIKSHASALYSLAVIQFNGSGGSKKGRDLQAGVTLCARAAFLGHIDALRELGHCLQDGYGVRQNIAQGRNLLVQANARELASSLRSLNGRQLQGEQCYQGHPSVTDSGCRLLSDFGCNVPAAKVHPANEFLKEWFESGMEELMAGLRLCSHDRCGRPETRYHEFRRCSVCEMVNYCSRVCQALDWKLRHKRECVPMEQWHNEGGAEGMAEEVDQVVDAQAVD